MKQGRREIVVFGEGNNRGGGWTHFIGYGCSYVGFFGNFEGILLL